jgi:2-dehydro-3-deoxygluconokinase
MQFDADRRIPLLAVGETMAMVVPERPEPLRTARSFAIAAGGAESNVAAHLAALGHRVAWASRLGSDPLGDRVLDELVACGVDVSLVVRDPSRPTGVYFKDPGPTGTRVHYYRAGSAASAIDEAFVRGLPLAAVGIVHVSGITAALSQSCRSALVTLVDLAHEAGAIVSFDVNHRPALWSAVDAAPVLRGIADRADLVLVGRDEAETLWGTPDADAVRALLRAPVLVVKDGAVGAHEFTGDAAAFLPAPVVDVVEAVGAGDAFAAGYLSSVLDGGALGAGGASGGTGVAVAEALRRGHERAAVALTTMKDV